MADGVCNVAKGKIRYYAEQARDVAGAALVVVLLQATEADDTLNNYDDLAAMLAVAGNTEATFTNYARKEITGADVTVAEDDTGNLVDIDVPDQVYTAAGGTTDNTLVKALFCYDPDTAVTDDATLVLLSHHDFAVTTDGTDLTLQIATAGFARAA